MAHMYGHRTHWYLSVLVLGLRYLRCWTPFVVSTCWLWGRCVFALRRNMSHKQYCSDLFQTLRLTHRFSSCFRLSTPCQQLRDPSSSQLPRSLRKNIQNRKQNAYGNGFPHKSASSAIKQLTRSIVTVIPTIHAFWFGINSPQQVGMVFAAQWAPSVTNVSTSADVIGNS